MKQVANVVRGDFVHWLSIPTRWIDNDIYGHVNNVVYLSYFDTVINHYLISVGGLDIQAGPVIGLCAESHCRYFSDLTFPEVVTAGLKVVHLGQRSVRYEVGLFRDGQDQAAAAGWFVHVFVERVSRRATAIPTELRVALERIHVPPPVSPSAEP
jgi:acyl-CoA thioester hydrolase